MAAAETDAGAADAPAHLQQQRHDSAAATAAPPPPWPTRAECPYAACYCEENVWHLVAALAARPLPGWQLWVAFISNADKSVPLWCQRAASSPGAATLWDYHVLALATHRQGHASLVLDLDSTLPFPCSLAEYRQCALLGGDDSLPPQYRRSYRLVSAPLYLRHFSSDRSHMQDVGGGWLQPPPSWPAIAGVAGGPPNLLPAYLDFGAGAGRQQHVGGQAQQAQQQVRQQLAEEDEQRRQQDDGGALAAAAADPLGVVLPEPALLAALGGAG